jgi:WD40 repeat protein
MRIITLVFFLAVGSVGIVWPGCVQAQENYPVEIVPALSHWAGANALALSPDNRLIASGDTPIRIWDFSTGRLVRTLAGHPGGLGVMGLAFDPTSKSVFSVGNGDPIKMWDIATGTRVLSLKEESSGAIRGDYLAISQDGRWIAFSDFEGAKLVDARSGTILKKLSVFGPLSFSPDGRRLVAQGSDATIVILDRASGRQLQIMEGHSKSKNFGPEGENDIGINCIAFSSGGKFIVSGSQDKTVKVWDGSSGLLLRSIKAHSAEVKWLAVTPDEGFIISAGADKVVKKWDITTGRLVRTLSNNASTSTISRDGRWLVTGNDRAISITSIEDGATLRIIPSQVNVVGSVNFSNDGKLLSASWDGKIRLWGLKEGRLLRSIDAYDGRATAAAFTPDERYAVSGDQKDYGAANFDAKVKRPLKLWDLSSGKLTKVFNGEHADVESIVFSDDKKYMVSSGLGKPIIWDFVSGRLVHEIDAFSQAVITPDGRYLLAGQYVANTVGLWDIKSGMQIKGIKNSFSSRYFGILPGGRRFYSAGDSRIMFWDLEQLKPLGVLGTHEDETLVGISAVAFAGSGSMIISGAGNGTLKLWDLRQPHPEGFLIKAHPEGVRSIAISRDESLIASTSSDGAIRLWDAKRPGKAVGTLIGSGRGEWISITPDGFFNESPAGYELLSVVRGLQVFAMEQLHQSLYNPDLVREAMAGDPSGEVKKAASVTSLGKVIDSGPAPEVEITSQLTRSSSDTDVVSVSVRIKDRGKGIGRIEWRVNHITVGVANAAASVGPVYEIKRDLALDPGENKIEVIAYNASNLLASLPAQTSIVYSGATERVKPKLHIFAIGINAYSGNVPKLNLAVADAKAFAAEMQKAGAGLYGEVRVRTVLDAEADTPGLARAVDEFAADIHPRDTFVFFAAAHGFSRDGRFYLIPQDYPGGIAPETLAVHAIGQEKIQDWIVNRIKAKKAIILLDTCESGALTQGYSRSRVDRPASEAAIGRLHEATGRPVLTAAAEGQEALEVTKLGHGVFTSALIDALHHGDTNRNGRIEVSELAAYVEDVVPKLARSGEGRFAIPRGEGSASQSAHFGTTGSDFALVARLP